jgi:hypothetical protein
MLDEIRGIPGVLSVRSVAGSFSVERIG